MIIDAPVPGQIGQLRELWMEAFGDTEEFLDTFFTVAFSPERSRCLCVDGKVAAALYWLDCSHMGKPVAYIYAVATAKAYRGRRLCHQLMEATHAHLERRGYRGAILVPGSKELFRLYAGMGYQTCCGLKEFDCISGDCGTILHRVDGETYAKLRQQMLPAGGVVQEKENMEFLQTQAALYAGDGFILAAVRDKEKLWGTELLGDVEAAPKILHALGCASGTFCTPGDTPFAMYLPLGDDDLPTPGYFGLAFD